jgi:hypothetical protein
MTSTNNLIDYLTQQINTIHTQIQENKLQDKTYRLLVKTDKLQEKKDILQAKLDRVEYRLKYKNDVLQAKHDKLECIPTLFNTFFRKTDNPNDKIPLQLIWDTIRPITNNQIMRNTLYKYVRELFNVPVHTTKKAEIIYGIISI